jgi:hypothetical protein
MERVLERALEELAEIADVNWRGAARNAVCVAARELGVDIDAETLETLASRALKAGRLWQKEALRKVWEVLGISLPPWAEDRLTPGRSWCTWPVVSVFLYEGPRGPRVRVVFSSERCLNRPLRKDRPLEPFAVTVWPGGAEVEVFQGLRARKGRAYMVADSPQGVEKALGGTRLLRPLFAFLDLADLEEALLALGQLGDGEVRTEGPYLLARKGRTRVLFRGSLTGAPDLDGALLVGREAVLLGTGEVAVRLKAKVEGGAAPRLWIEEGVLEWDGERACFEGGQETLCFYKRGAFSRLLREALRTALRAEPAPSPRTRALVEEPTAGEDPLEALKARDLPQRVHLRLLSRH